MDTWSQKLLANLPEIENVIGHSFLNKELLIQAFTHQSFLNECAKELATRPSNERLEFLGDAVVNLYVTEELYTLFPDVREGTLSKRKAALVSQECLHNIINSFGLAVHLLVGRGERIKQTYLLPSIQCDLFEAITGAVYLDGGFHAAVKVLRTLFKETFANFQDLLEEKNPKATLQEMAAQLGFAPPEYLLIEETGLQHQKQFHVSVSLGGTIYGKGRGMSKKEAQKRAAAAAIELLKE